MEKRLLKPNLECGLESQSLALLWGLPYVGKSVLAQRISGRYFNLRDKTDREEIRTRLNKILQSDQRIIIDELDTMPEVLPSLLENPERRQARLLLVSRVNPAMVDSLPKALKSQLRIFELSPLLLKELGKSIDPDRRWFYGGYTEAGLLRKRQHPSWPTNYLHQLAHQHLPDAGMPINSEATEKLFKEIALRHGEPWNASEVARAIGSDYRTVNRCVEFLGRMTLVRRLPPLPALDCTKRISKRAVVYWRDTGLLHSLLGIDNLEDIQTSCHCEASWRGFAIEQFLAFLDAECAGYKAWQFQTSDKYSLDLVLEIGGDLWAFQFLYTDTAGQGELLQLHKTTDLVKAKYRVLVTRNKRAIEHEEHAIVNLPWLFEEFRNARVW